MKKNKLILIFAIVVILVGIGSSVYVNALQVDTKHITVNGQDFSIDQLFDNSEEKTYETYSGIALDDMIIKAGVEHPEKHEYTFIGADGYQKTVQWENMINGLLTKERKSIFPDLPKAFRIKDTVEIEVVEK
ncbi:MAG: hypothetical protein J7L66_06355 [Anaerolineaceae bacterium]|nr:hypothetical protein [Anaerolineaceae bacterium]